jgi:hypothetical protein
MKFALYVFLAAAFGKACAREASVTAREAEQVVVKSGVNASEVALSRAASITSRYILRDMSKESKYVSYDSTSNTFKLSNIE